MFTSSVNSNLLKASECVVCGKPVPRHLAVAQKNVQTPNCQAVHCKQVMSKQETMSQAAFEHYLRFERKVLSDRATSQAKEKERIAALEDEQANEAEQLRQDALAHNPDVEKIRLVTIPSGRTNTVSIEVSRFENYQAHIRKLVQQAQTYATASEVPYTEGIEGIEREIEVDARLAKEPALAEFSDKLCSQCKGGCCTSGRDHAYISILVIRKFMDRHQELSSEQVEQAYLDLLPRQVIEDSCINHSTKGCVLPRDMRSGICNSFYCDDLNKYQKEIVGGEPLSHTLVIQRSKPYWARYTESGVNEVIRTELVDVTKESTEN